MLVWSQVLLNRSVLFSFWNVLIFFTSCSRASWWRELYLKEKNLHSECASGLNEASAVAWLWSHDLSVVLLRYHSVLQHATYSAPQSTSPILLCTIKYHSVLLSTTLKYNVIGQYYSVLHSSASELLYPKKCYASSTINYASTTLYSSNTPVLCQYYTVLQSTTPVSLR